MDSWDNPAYDAALAYQRTAALTAAIRLNIVTLIGGGATTSSSISNFESDHAARSSLYDQV